MHLVFNDEKAKKLSNYHAWVDWLAWNPSSFVMSKTQDNSGYYKAYYKFDGKDILGFFPKEAFDVKIDNFKLEDFL